MMRKKLIREVENVAKKFDLVGFKINNFDMFSGRAIYVNIMSSDEELVKLRDKLVEKLAKFCKLKKHDHDEYIPHATLILNTDLVGNSGKDVSQKFRGIMKFLNSWSVPGFTMHVLRITILNDNSKILCEYDLMHKKMLNRREALNRDIYRTTIEKYKEKTIPSSIKSKIFRIIRT